VKDIIANKFFIGCFLLLTVYVIFGPDLVLLCFDKDADFSFQVANTAVLFFFIVELVMQVTGRRGYWKKVPFWLDLISVISILPDTYLLHANSVNEELGAANIMNALVI